MIAHLRGRLISAGSDSAVIDVGGVGYLVSCSARTLAALPAPGEAVELQIETQMREDSITLYGFVSAAEREWFRLLQGIQGVGARVALSLLAVLEPDQLTQAVAASDRAMLTRANGVGPRLASRIISELKDRVGSIAVTAQGTEPIVATPAGGPSDDALSALVNLGYGRAEAFAAIARIRATAGENASVDDLIRLGLKELSTT